MIKLIIIDDHKILSEGLALMLSKFEDINVLACLENSNQTMDFLKDNTIDIILLDYHLKDEKGYDILLNIKKNYPNIKVIFLTMHQDIHTIFKVVKAGADSFLLKDVEINELYNAITQVNTKGKYYTDIVVEALEKGFKNENSPYANILITTREKEILLELKQGLSSKQIAHKFNVSPRTIDTHRNNLLKKFNCSSSLELIKLATDFHYIE